MTNFQSIIKIPYYSQFVDVKDHYWVPRACMIACLKMILEYHGKAKDLSIDDLIKKGEAIGAYGKWGWIHDGIITLAHDFGIPAYREEKMNEGEGILKIKDSILKKNPPIVSIIKDILGQKKFHTVVIVGYEEKDGKISGFYFHDPESTSEDRNREPIFVDIKTFLNEWRKMAIFFELS